MANLFIDFSRQACLLAIVAWASQNSSMRLKSTHFLLWFLLILALANCSTMQRVGTTTQKAGTEGFRFARQVVTGEIPRASRFVTQHFNNLFFQNSDASFWHAEHIRGKPSVLISLSEQTVYLFKNGQLAGGSPVSSGAEGYNTRPGRYRIIEKDIDHLSSIYGDYIDSQGNILATNIDNRKDLRPRGARFDGAKMHYFMRIYDGVGMHQGYLPGYPASHGCIRLPGHMAEKFFHEVHLGTPVEIVP